MEIEASDGREEPSVPDLVGSLPPALGGRCSPPSVLPDLRSRIVTKLMRANARLMSSQLDAQPVVDAAAVGGLLELQREWRTVRAEWDAVRERSSRLPTMDDMIGIPPGWDGDWEWFAIHSYSRWEPRALASTPRTVELLSGVDGLVQAAFSVLRPGTFLHPHRGTNTGVLRGLVGIVVSEPESCGLLVGDRRLDYGEGELRVFDDTFEHAAWNAGTTERVALLLEIRRSVGGLADGLNRISQRAYRHHALVARGMARVEPLMRELEDAAPRTRG